MISPQRHDELRDMARRLYEHYHTGTISNSQIDDALSICELIAKSPMDDVPSQELMLSEAAFLLICLELIFAMDGDDEEEED